MVDSDSLGEGVDVAPLGLDKYRLTPDLLAKFQVQPVDQQATTKRKRQWFIRGPLPGEWWRIAATLGVSAVRVALAIWTEAGMRKSRTIKISRDMRRRFSVDRIGPGLADLEAAGLVSVDRQRGRRPEITILDVAEPAGDSQ